MPNKKKTEAYICPKCGEDRADCDDIKWSLEDGIELKLKCECGHLWTDFFAVAYDGYSDKTGEYDALGHQLVKGSEPDEKEETE